MPTKAHLAENPDSEPAGRELLEHRQFMQEAMAEAAASYAQGGIPVGAVLVRAGKIIGRGHNVRVQEKNPILHGEMSCMVDAGRQRTYRDTALYTTLSPCMMCSGTIVQFGIPVVVIGENRTFGGNEKFLEEHNVRVIVLDDSGCRELMGKFIHEQPEIWAEDIGCDGDHG